MPKIPVNPQDLPTEVAPMDETLTYVGFIRSLELADHQDKNGQYFLQGKVEVTEPDDYRGKILADNYIAIPMAPPPDADAKTRARIMESGVRLGRLCASANYKGDAGQIDTNDLIGKEVKFSVKNDEYQGRNIPRVNDYLI